MKKCINWSVGNGYKKKDCLTEKDFKFFIKNYTFRDDPDYIASLLIKCKSISDIKLKIKIKKQAIAIKIKI